MLEQNLINYYEVTRQTKTTWSSAAKERPQLFPLLFSSSPHWDPLHLWPPLHHLVLGVKSILQRRCSRSLQKRSKFFLLINCVSSFFYPPLQESKWLDERESVGTAGSYRRVDGTLLLKCCQQSLFFDPTSLTASERASSKNVSLAKVVHDQGEKKKLQGINECKIKMIEELWRAGSVSDGRTMVRLIPFARGKCCLKQNSSKVPSDAWLASYVYQVWGYFSRLTGSLARLWIIFIE